MEEVGPAGTSLETTLPIKEQLFFMEYCFDKDEPWRGYCINPWLPMNRQKFHFSNFSSPPILAVLRNDVGELEKLFQNGLSADTHLNGNNLLPFAAIKEKTDVFRYLIQRHDVHLDLANFQGLTILALVLVNQNYDYAKYLINAGANVNLKSRDNNSPLHYAILDLEMTKILLDKGADVNAVNELNETPLYCACYARKSDVALELICNGADTSIRTTRGMIAFDKAVSQSNCKELTDFLFHTSFHTSTCTLINIINASKTEYFDIFTHKFTCDEYSFDEFCHFGSYIENANVNEFETLLNTNPDVIIDLFGRDMLDIFCCQIAPFNNVEMRRSIITKLEMLFSKTEVICEIIETYQQYDPLICCLAVEGLLDLNELTKLSCMLMMHGIQVYDRDLYTIYGLYGYCELFEIMLHMDIVEDHQYPDIKESLITFLMYNMNYDMDVCLQNPEKFIFETNIDGLIQHFALPKFKEHCLKIGNSTQIERVKNLPTIPSLVELSRNAARKYIKKKFNVKTNCQFYTTLNSLPIPKCHKDIIAFKTPLYNV